MWGKEYLGLVDISFELILIFGVLKYFYGVFVRVEVFWDLVMNGILFKIWFIMGLLGL